MNLAQSSVLALIAMLVGCRSTPRALAPIPLDRVIVATDTRGFALEQSGKPFTPWGLNYGNAGRLIEDFWHTDWQSIEQDWTEMRALGANVVRVHLQFGKFMRSPTEPNPDSLARLADLCALSERTGLYLDITGLAAYRKSSVPAWYDTLSEAERWNAQATFWAAVAETCRSSPAIFCYDLMNEPISPASRRNPGEWYSGHLLGEYDFIQYIALDPSGRTREQIADAWIKTLTSAIRRHDRRTPITVGMLPWIKGWGHMSGFIPAQLTDAVDFLSVHIYPNSSKPDEAVKALEECNVGKTLVIEETFPLSCSPDELSTFLRGSTKIASGWMGHYDGITIEEYEALAKENKITVAQSMWLSWLKLFVTLRTEFAP